MDPKLTRHIKYFGYSVVVACDGNCEKAWGNNSRPQVQLSDDPEDFAFLADDELGIAPADPGTYEGGDGKAPRSLNRWCVRECERADFAPTLAQIKLPDFSKRVYNIPSKHPDAT